MFWESYCYQLGHKVVARKGRIFYPCYFHESSCFQTCTPLRSTEVSTSTNPARDLGHTCPCCALSYRAVESSRVFCFYIAQRYDILHTFRVLDHTLVWSVRLNSSVGTVDPKVIIPCGIKTTRLAIPLSHLSVHQPFRYPVTSFVRLASWNKSFWARLSFKFRMCLVNFKLSRVWSIQQHDYYCFTVIKISAYFALPITAFNVSIYGVGSCEPEVAKAFQYTLKDLYYQL